jgi:DNA-binding transcriptional MerR regulator/methylmalonyl-CoA mutase cobalamin-binding subunit
MFSIGVVARQTGVAIGTLRKWEARYGFPLPMRGESGQRFYSASDIDKLLVVVRRVAGGERIGKVIQELSDSVQRTDAPRQPSALIAPPPAAAVIDQALNALCDANVPDLKAVMEDALAARTLLDFVEEVAAPLTYQVGEHWASGRLPIYGEHLYSSILEDFLTREASLSSSALAKPVVLLTSLAGEQHTLGLAMVNAVLAEAGIASLRLPGGLPLQDIVAASLAYGVRVVGVSTSAHYPPRMLLALVAGLRASLPPDVALWCGGAGMEKVVGIPAGVLVISSMHQMSDAIAAMNLNGAQQLHQEEA